MAILVRLPYLTTMPDATTAIPAATLVVLRDRPGAAPEFLMVERSRRLAFAGGALVFPGGRIDPGDHGLAGRSDDESAARFAAIRETFEETGVLVAIDGGSGREADVRAGLAAGTSFADALAAAGLVPRPEALVSFARWRPAHHVTRIFDTRFYLASAPADIGTPIADGTETARVFWTTAAAALAQVATGSATMIFPTRRVVERLESYADVDAAMADAAARPIRTVTPWTEQRDGETYLCIPDDLGYPVTAQRLADVSRG